MLRREDVRPLTASSSEVPSFDVIARGLRGTLPVSTTAFTCRDDEAAESFMERRVSGRLLLGALTLFSCVAAVAAASASSALSAVGVVESPLTLGAGVLADGATASPASSLSSSSSFRLSFSSSATVESGAGSAEFVSTTEDSASGQCRETTMGAGASTLFAFSEPLSLLLLANSSPTRCARAALCCPLPQVLLQECCERCSSTAERPASARAMNASTSVMKSPEDAAGGAQRKSEETTLVTCPLGCGVAID